MEADQPLTEHDRDSRRNSNDTMTAILKSPSDEKRPLTNNHQNLIQLQRPTINTANSNKSLANSFRKLTLRSEPPQNKNQQQVSQGKPLLHKHIELNLYGIK